MSQPRLADITPTDVADADAPARVETEGVFRRGDSILFVLLSILALAAIGNFFFIWFVEGALRRSPFLFTLVTGLVLFWLFNQQGRWYLLLRMRRPKFIAAPAGVRAAVVTTYVPHAESIDMIEHALRAMVAIRYPHDTWLLDEGDDPAARSLCEQLGVRHFSRRSLPRYQADAGPFRKATKYGNYNAWLHEVGYRTYDVVSAFDSDHVPHPEYLHQVLGYFRDPEVGYVTPAQAYYNQAASFIARGAAEDTYAYYSVVQMASYALGYPIVVGGHNVHRATALEQVGGFAPHDADDLLITLRYSKAGWRGVFVPRILAHGLTPVDWRGYLQQQRRWARSVIDIKVREWRAGSGKMSLQSRLLSVMQGINFASTGVIGTVLYIVLLGIMLRGGIPDFFSSAMFPAALVLIGVIALLELFRQRFFLNPRVEGGLHWRSALLWYAKWPWFLGALLDVMRGRRYPYVITLKAGRRRVYDSFVYAHAVLALGIVVAGVAGRLLHGRPMPVTLTAGAIVAATSLFLAWTELRGFPASFDLRYWRPVPAPPTS